MADIQEIPVAEIENHGNNAADIENNATEIENKSLFSTEEIMSYKRDQLACKKYITDQASFFSTLETKINWENFEKTNESAFDTMIKLRKTWEDLEVGKVIQDLQSSPESESSSQLAEIVHSVLLNQNEITENIFSEDPKFVHVNDDLLIYARHRVTDSFSCIHFESPEKVLPKELELKEVNLFWLTNLGTRKLLKNDCPLSTNWENLSTFQEQIKTQELFYTVCHTHADYTEVERPKSAEKGYYRSNIYDINLTQVCLSRSFTNSKYLNHYVQYQSTGKNKLSDKHFSYYPILDFYTEKFSHNRHKELSIQNDQSTLSSPKVSSNHLLKLPISFSAQSVNDQKLQACHDQKAIAEKSGLDQAIVK